jgi:hypothetical protein
LTVAWDQPLPPGRRDALDRGLCLGTRELCRSVEKSRRQPAVGEADTERFSIGHFRDQPPDAGSSTSQDKTEPE